MKRDFKTIKNIILLIASALTLVAVTFSWFSLSKKVGNFKINSTVSGTTLSVKYFESADGGKNYTRLKSDLSMENMYEGKKAYYRMDVKTFKDKPVKLIMSFDGLSSSNTTAGYVYFDYRLVSASTEEVIKSETGLKMSDYASSNVFVQDVTSYQKKGENDFNLYYDVYVVTGSGASIPNANQQVSLGSVKLLGQQVN